MNEKKNSEKKSGLKFASVPYRVNPETNYSGVSGSNLMPDITNANLTPSHQYAADESVFEKVSCGDYNTYATMSI
jgi:hypothetical protein